MAAASTVPSSTVAVPLGLGLGLGMFGPPRQDLIGAVVATTTRHTGGGVVDIEPGEGEMGGRKKKKKGRVD